MRIGDRVGDALSAGEGDGDGGVRRVDVGLAQRDDGFRLSRGDGLVGGAAQHHRGGDRSWRRLVTVVDGVEEVDAGPVGETGDGDVGELLGGAGDLEGAADGGVGLVEQGQSLPGPVPLADVERRAEHPSDLAGRVPHR